MHRRKLKTMKDWEREANGNCQYSWYDYAKLVIAEAEKRGFPVRVEAENIHPIPTSAYPTPARRPLNSRLDGSLLESVFGLKMPDWQSGVIRMLDELLA